jgi:transcriptional regulator with XRE-family HTH domain
MSPPSHGGLRTLPENWRICDEWSNCRMRRLTPPSGPGPAGRHLAYVVASTIRESRLAIGWSQGELARRAGTSQSTESRIERGLTDRVDLAAIGRLLDALQVRAEMKLEAPFLADRRRQRDPAHAHCVAYVARRLTTSEWLVQMEVEIQGKRSHGWIDVLAYRHRDRALLVIEIKTEIEDLGRIERSIGWYVREGPRARHRFGWYPRQSIGALIILDTRATADRLRANRDATAQSFPVRAEELRRWVQGESGLGSGSSRAIAAIDPASRRAAWLRPTVLDGRRSPAAYEDYADFMRHIHRVRRG